MLQRQTFPDVGPDQGEAQGQGLSIGYLLDVLKRRALYFLIPFLTILAIGSLITFAWPAKYLAQGRILISSQEIPTELVRPTVSTLSNERIQYIQQRIMTRDNLLAIAKKFNLSMGWQGLVSGSEIVDFIRERTQIKPYEGTLQGERKQAIAFTVGFEYENPAIATRVANELVTMILNEDVRTRTGFASETTKFLEREVKRLEDQLASINSELLERQKLSSMGMSDPDSDTKNLAALRAQLTVKGAIYSESHPEIRALKRQIDALEKGGYANKPGSDGDAKDAASNANNPL